MSEKISSVEVSTKDKESVSLVNNSDKELSEITKEKRRKLRNQRLAIEYKIFKDEINEEKEQLKTDCAKLSTSLSHIHLRLLRRDNGLNNLLRQKRRLIEKLLMITEKLITILVRLYYRKYDSPSKEDLKRRADNIRKDIREKKVEFKLWVAQQKALGCPAIHSSNESCLICLPIL